MQVLFNLYSIVFETLQLILSQGFSFFPYFKKIFVKIAKITKKIMKKIAKEHVNIKSPFAKDLHYFSGFISNIL